MTRHVGRLLLVTAIATAALAATLAARQEKEPTFPDALIGRWDLTVQGANGPYPSWLHVHMRTDSTLQAEFVGRFGSVRAATVVQWANDQLTVVIPIQYESNKSDLKFVGKLVGPTLTGTTEDENGKTLNWTAMRAPASGPVQTVAWGTPIALLNKNDLGGWKQRSTAKGTCWTVTDGVLSNVPPCADLITEKAFTDFKVHVELMYPAHSNSGVYLRGRYEAQIQDDYGKTLDAHRMGGIYGFVCPYVNAVKPAGEWQAYDITLIGRRVTVVLNDTTIIDNEIIPGITGGAIDSLESAAGPLMLQGDHGKISFRNVTVTPAK